MPFKVTASTEQTQPDATAKAGIVGGYVHVEHD